MAGDPPDKPQGYSELFIDLVARIRAAQQRAGASVTREVVLLYWGIGKAILARQESQGWGAKVVDRLAADLQRTFPGVRGLSSRNLRSMRDLAREFPCEAQQLLPNCPWGHLLLVMTRLKDLAEREWYLRACVERGWSRNVLATQIDSGLYRREGSAVSNFERTLAPPDSDLARQAIKDPYNFDFLTIAGSARERLDDAPDHRGLD